MSDNTLWPIIDTVHYITFIDISYAVSQPLLEDSIEKEAYCEGIFTA